MKARSKAGRIVRWLPFLAFAVYVGLTVTLKDRTGTQDVETIRPEAAENCTRICDRLAECALSAFGNNEANQARLPQLKTSCFSGCVSKESKVASCFTPENDIHCVALTACAIHFLQQVQ